MNQVINYRTMIYRGLMLAEHKAWNQFKEAADEGDDSQFWQAYDVYENVVRENQEYAKAHEAELDPERVAVMEYHRVSRKKECEAKYFYA